MNFIHSLLSNSFLALVLFAMLFLPIGVMGLSGTQRNDVLSETSIRPEIVTPRPDYVKALEMYQSAETSESTDLGQ